MPANIERQTLISGIIQLVVGCTCFILGTVETMMRSRSFASYFGTGIWSGLWIIATGIIGILAMRSRNCCGSLRCMAGVYMGFSITSIVIACMMIIMYSLVVAFYGHYIHRKEFVTVALLILIAAIVELGAAIWGVICSSLTVRCCAGQQTQGGQVVYMQTQEGAYVAYVVVQGSDGTPVAVPAQPGGPMVAPGGTQVISSQGGAVPTVVSPYYQQQPQSSVPVAVTTQAGGPMMAPGGTPQGGAVSSPHYQMPMQQQQQQQQMQNDPPKVAL